jgi:hypothetical protein
MSDSKEINLISFGIMATPEVKDIHKIKCIYLHNRELSQVVVLLKDRRKLYGQIVVGSGAEQTKEDILSEYGRILDGR